MKGENGWRKWRHLKAWHTGEAHSTPMSTTTGTRSRWEAPKSWLECRHPLYQGFEQPELPTDGKRPHKVMSLRSLEVIKQRVDNHNPVLQGGRRPSQMSLLTSRVSASKRTVPSSSHCESQKDAQQPKQHVLGSPQPCTGHGLPPVGQLPLPELQFSHLENAAGDTSPPYFTEISQRNIN